MTKRRPPSRESWGDLSDGEVKYGYKRFGGKTIEDAMPLFVENPIERSAELRRAPAAVFNYYVFCFARFLTSPQSEGESDCASCFLRLVLDRVTSERESIASIYTELKVAVDTVAGRQPFYDANEDIYGSFSDLRAEIESRYAQHDA